MIIRIIRAELRQSKESLSLHRQNCMNGRTTIRRSDRRGRFGLRAVNRLAWVTCMEFQLRKNKIALQLV